jgi:hypothetical protein
MGKFLDNSKSSAHPLSFPLLTSSVISHAFVFFIVAANWGDEPDDSDFLKHAPTDFVAQAASAEAKAEPASSRPPRQQSAPLEVPTEPPFKAFIRNLPFKAQEENIRFFFRGLAVRF